MSNSRNSQRGLSSTSNMDTTSSAVAAAAAASSTPMQVDSSDAGIVLTAAASPAPSLVPQGSILLNEAWHIFLAEIAQRFRIKEKAQLAKTCRAFRGLFQEELNKKRDEKVLELVMQADYEAAEVMVRKNPHLMFVEVKLECPNDCDLIQVPALLLENLDKLFIRSNMAYVRSGDKLWYINKVNNVCLEIVLNPDMLAVFDMAMTPTNRTKTLSKNDLERITAITRHTHPHTITEITTPLKRACWAYDTYMWRMFERVVKENPALKLMPKFEQQLCEQMTHINLKPFLDTYARYEIQRERGNLNVVTCRELDKDWLAELDQDWLLVGLMQAKYIADSKQGAMHMLREFCREGVSSWSSGANFNNALPASRESKVRHWHTGQYMTLKDLTISGGLGSVFSLIRGVREHGGWFDRGHHNSIYACARFDSSTFRHLCEVRSTELKQRQQNLLTVSSEQAAPRFS